MNERVLAEDAEVTVKITEAGEVIYENRDGQYSVNMHITDEGIILDLWKFDFDDNDMAVTSIGWEWEDLAEMLWEKAGGRVFG